MAQFISANFAGRRHAVEVNYRCEEIESQALENKITFLSTIPHHHLQQKYLRLHRLSFAELQSLHFTMLLKVVNKRDESKGLC